MKEVIETVNDQNLRKHRLFIKTNAWMDTEEDSTQLSSGNAATAQRANAKQATRRCRRNQSTEDLLQEVLLVRTRYGN
jgi:hypothetical protein